MLAEALPGGSAFWHERLLVWLMEAPVEPIGPASPRTARLATLLDAIHDHPQRDVLVERLGDAWSNPTVIRLVAESGLPSQLSLTKEVMHRLANRVLPRVRSADNLRDLVFRLDLTELDARWIASLDGVTIERCAALMATPRPLLLRAAQLISLRLGAIGMSSDILQLRPADDLLTSPFAELPAVVMSIQQARAQGVEPPDWQSAVARCRVALDQVSALIDQRGAPSTTLFRHELLGTLLTRLAVLLHVALDTGAVPARELAVLMTNAVVEDKSLEAIGRAQTKRLALKITEYTGGTGEDYVARNRKEYWQQFRAGAYGGCVTAFTALIKFGLAALPLAPVVLATGLAANYTISFWILQIFHFALASKQPAMTASALATSLSDTTDMEHNIELIAAISRSQAAVTVSNVGATVLLSLLLDFLFHQLTGRYFLSTETAEHALRGINPVLTLTALYAAITGLFLWLSSLAAGAAANWIAYRQLAEATREDLRLKRIFGKAFARRLGDFIDAHLGGMIGYLALGFLLGFVPVLMDRFFGIDLEVRHVTLHAAAAAYGVLPMRAAGELVPRDIFWGFVGIGVIGFFNFTVSGWLALLTAARARNLGPAERSVLWRAIRRAFLARPTRFFWVPARERKSFEMPTRA